MDPYREAEVVERTFERGACTWCRAELTVSGDDAVTCRRCGAQVGGPAARALRAKLVLEIPDEPRPSPSWIGRALGLVWDGLVVAGPFGFIACGWRVTLGGREAVPWLIGLFVSMPFAAAASMAWGRTPPPPE
jgi:ribosomal protein L40E